MPSKAVIAGRLPIRRGLDENEATIYLSLSPSFFRRLVADGRMPRPRLIGERRIWDVEELDLAFKALPREGGNRDPIFVEEGRGEASNPWDEVLRS
jgi:predicted DNA-binding transcriptional regulator AlpA